MNFGEMEQKKISKTILIILAIVFLVTGVFYYLAWKKIIKNPFISNSPKTKTSQPEQDFHKTLVRFQFANVAERTMTGEINLPTPEFIEDSRKAISDRNAFYEKTVEFKIDSETLFFDTHLEELKEGDYIQVETKENLIDYSEGDLNLVSVKKI